MKTSFILILSIFCIACTRQPNTPRFSQEQIQSLHLDSTLVLSVDSDSIINIDLNSFLKKRVYDLGSLIDEVKLIPLETKDISALDEEESLLGDIYKIIVSDSNIYVHDKFKGGGIVIFDQEGKFIRRIPYGQGPGELVRLYDIAYDPKENELIVYVHSHLMYFTSKGEFIRQVKLPFGFYNFTVIPDGYVFKTLDGQGNEHLENYKDFTLLVTDKNFLVKSVSLPCNSKRIDYGGYNYLFKNDNSLEITERFVDTIYQYKSDLNQLKAKYAFDYRDKKLPEHLTQSTTGDFFKAIREHNYYYYLGEYLETNHHNVFFLMNDYTGLKTLVYRDKQTGNLQGGTFGKYDDINEIPSMGFPITTSGDYFIACHFPGQKENSLFNSSIITDEDKRKIKKLTEDDNPVLVFFKIKNF